MILRTGTYALRALAVVYLLFVFSCTFSIAAAQITLGLATVLFLLTVMLIRYHPTRMPLGVFYAFVLGYVIWLAMSSAVASTFVNGILTVREEWLFIAIPIGVLVASDDVNNRRLFAAFGSGVMLIALYAIIQHFTGWYWLKSHPLPPAPDGGYLACGNFPHPLTFGNFYATAALFLLGAGFVPGPDFSKRLRTFLVVAGVLAALATMLSYSRGSILAVLVGLMLGAAMIRRRYLIHVTALIVIGIGVVALVQPATMSRVRENLSREIGTSNVMSRLFIWSRTAEIVAEHPVFGVGQGNFAAAYGPKIPADSRERAIQVHAHNDLLNAAAIGGIPAMVLFGALWFFVLKSFWKGFRESAPGTPERR
ncbi:MAG: O-antigen ligase family protein, partial [Bacteroidetes bacterium]|nr:O-antigen ligase family protein [Bacteroidota bacterium]